MWESIRNEVDKWAQQGVVSIKMKQATPGEARLLIEYAHKNGMTTAGHLANYNVEYDVSTRDAILMGIDRIEHQLLVGTDEPVYTSLLPGFAYHRELLAMTMRVYPRWRF